MNQKIAIIGCDDMGAVLAKFWMDHGHHVTVTTQDPQKVEMLSKVAQKSLLLRSHDEEELTSLIEQNEILLIMTFADDTEQSISSPLCIAQTLRRLALAINTPRRLICMSHPSVYGDHQGCWVDELSELRAKSDYAKKLINAEQIYLSLQEIGWSVSILRVAEVYGPHHKLSERIMQLKEQVLPGLGNQYANMVHEVDYLRAVDYALHHDLEGIFNIADDKHPTLKELYDQLTQKLGYPNIKWNPSLACTRSENRRVSNHKIKSEGFTFHHPAYTPSD